MERKMRLDTPAQIKTGSWSFRYFAPNRYQLEQHRQKLKPWLEQNRMLSKLYNSKRRKVQIQ
jgi:hypothetical protein